MEIRIQKIVAQAGLASRREAERLIGEGRVTVNGKVASLGEKADPERDAVKVSGRLITRREPPVYFVLNKPLHVLTTMRDEEEKDRPTVADFLKRTGKRAFPVGRLDFDVEGVLLLTNDGELANRLAHPRYRVPRIYEAKIKGIPSERALERMARGAGTVGPKSDSAKIQILRRKAEKNTWLRIELQEGKHHQVKRMCRAVGHPVIKLVRVAFGGIRVRGLPPGGIRPLTVKEVSRLRSLAEISDTANARKAPKPEPPIRRAGSRSKPPAARSLEKRKKSAAGGRQKKT